MSMPQPDSSQAYLRLIDALEEAASCARQLAFMRQQQAWLKVDVLILGVRTQIIALAQAADSKEPIQ